MLIHTQAFSAGVSDNNWINIQATYDFHFNGIGGMEKLLSKEGEEIVDKMQKYISDPKNRKNLNTPEGNKLLKHHQKYLNFIQSKRTLDACENDKNSKRKLEKAILVGSLDSDVNFSPCRKEYLLAFKSLYELEESVKEISKEELIGPLSHGLNQHSVINSTESYMELRYRYDPNFLKGDIGSEELESIYKKACPREEDCSATQKDLLRKSIKNKALDLKKNKEKTSPANIAASINSRINGLNKKLDAIHIPRDKGVLTSVFDNGVHFFIPGMIDTADPELENEDVQKGFNSYLEDYIDMTKNEDGMLLYTESIRDAMGALRTADSDEYIDEDTHLTTSTYSFERHQEVSENDVKDGIENIFSSIDEQFKKLRKMSKKQSYDKRKLNHFQKNGNKNAAQYLKDKFNKSRKEDIVNLVKTNPKAVSQILANSPEYAPLICDALIEIDKDDEDTVWDDVFLYGGVALGALGFVTGGATWLLGGALSAATAATLGTVTTGLLIASTASELTATTINLSNSYQMNKEAKEIERGIISGNSYTSSTEFMRDSYLSYKNALYDAGSSALISIVGMGALGAINRLGKSGAKIVKKDKDGNEVEADLKLDKNIVDNMTSTYNFINRNKNASEVVKNTLQKLGKNGQEKLDEFFAQLAMMPDATRDKFLLALAKMSPNSPKLKELVTKALCKK